MRLLLSSLLTGFSPNSVQKERAYDQFVAFVQEGITKESPWKELNGQIFLGDKESIRGVKTGLPEDLRRCPEASGTQPDYLLRRSSEGPGNSISSRQKGGCTLLIFTMVTR